MLFYKKTRAIRQQKLFFIKEIYYKLYKLFLIFLKWNKKLSGLFFNRTKIIYYKNICIISGKSKSLFRKLKLSRIMIREQANKGLVFGLIKLSW